MANDILDALSNVSDAVLEAHYLTRTFSDLRGDDCSGPEWPFVVERTVDRIRVAFEHLETLVRAVTPVSGYGAAPHGD